MLAISLTLPLTLGAANEGDGPHHAAEMGVTDAPYSTISPSHGAVAQTDDEPTLRVVTTTLEPFVFTEGGRLTGFYWEIWESTAAEAGIDYEIIVVDRFPDVLEALKRGEADVGVAPIAPTAEREAFMDFSVGIIQSGAQIGISPDLVTDVSLRTAFRDWTLARLLGLGLLVLIVISHVVWIVERRHPESDFRSSYFGGVWDAFWWASVTITTVGYGDTKVRRPLGRIVALTWMLFGLFFVAAFVAQVTSRLTVERLEASIDSVEDLRDERVAVLSGTTFEDALIELDIATVPVDSQNGLFDAMRSGDADAVVTNPYSLQFFSTHGARGHVVPVGEVFIEEFETFGLQQDSPWRERINVAILDLERNGVTDLIVTRWFPER